ncbi:MAG: hypothetical protein K1562_03475 [Candidatus Thiodiazotropha sp. (ex. Lucinisca nassula)]|nr:hypothetical protein [Candidatus Thiodiazotropha sp. (ex. Lucinisca nassula)]
MAEDGRDTRILHQEAFKLPTGQFRLYPFQETPQLEEHAEDHLTTSPPAVAWSKTIAAV